ncbi:MAG: polysaccharide biosynthesis tyrosine autokinase [Rhodopirellula sp.]|nr:polysaccharide biosynthesis tyrosine autokinase [Rhodopirellula sp.]
MSSIETGSLAKGTTHPRASTSQELHTRPPSKTVKPGRSTQKSGPRGNPVWRALQLAEPMTPQGLLLACKRRWKPALLIGIPAAVLAAAAAWVLVPAYYTSFALLKVASTEPRLVFKKAESEQSFDTYRQTQMAMIQSRFVLNAALRRPGISELETIRTKAFPLEWLEENIVVGTYNSPEILKISLAGGHPEDITKIVNAVKDAFLDEVVLADRKQRIARLNELERIHSETEEKVRQKEQRVESLAKELGTGDSQALSIKHQMALEQISLLRREHARVRFELMRAQINEQSVGAAGVEADLPVLLGSSPEAGVALGASPGKSQAALTANRITQLQALISRYEAQVVDQNHPTLQKYRDELQQLQASTGSVETSGGEAHGSRLDILKRQEKLLAEELEKYSDLVKNIGSSSFELELMKSDIAQISKVSDQVGSEMESHRIELKSPTRITLMQEAEIPQVLDLGKKKKLTGAAGIGAIGFVFLAISLIEFHSRRITDPQDISQTLGLDLLGSLPAMPKPLIKFWEQPKESRMALWNNALIEAVDSTRSILLHDPDVEQRRVLMVASAAAQEGKTTFACQLAGSLARAGRKTVLVDFDLRRPRAHELLNVPLELGLSELLSEKLDVQTVLHSTSESCLSVIPAGRVNEAALQSIAQNGADWLFEELKKEFEFVIVDSSPILYVADGASVGRNVDGAIMVVRSHASRLPAVAVACERIEMLGIDLIGGVMVGVQSNLSGYGYSYDYHYGTTSG